VEHQNGSSRSRVAQKPYFWKFKFGWWRVYYTFYVGIYIKYNQKWKFCLTEGFFCIFIVNLKKIAIGLGYCVMRIKNW
jgi:hypothetical protein